jgi:DNA phosphorothioation-dependent restriction protein DptG
MSEFNPKSDLTSVLNRVNALENERKTLQEQNERLERLAQTKREETKTQIDTMIAKWLEDITNAKKEEAIKKEIDALRNKNATLTQTLNKAEEKKNDYSDGAAPKAKKDEANMLALTQSMERLRVTEAATAECIASIQAAIAEYHKKTRPTTTNDTAQ